MHDGAEEATKNAPLWDDAHVVQPSTSSNSTEPPHHEPPRSERTAGETVRSIKPHAGSIDMQQVERSQKAPLHGLCKRSRLTAGHGSTDSARGIKEATKRMMLAHASVTH